MRHLLFCLLLLILAGCGKPPMLAPDEFRVQAELSPEDLHVGDPVVLTLTAQHPAGSRIRFPTIGKPREVVVLNQTRDTRELSETTLETKCVIQLTSFRVGDWLVTTNPAVCTFSNGVEKAQMLPKLILFVGSSLEGSTKLSDIKDSGSPSSRFLRVVWVLLLVSLLALAAGLLSRLVRRKMNPFAPEAPPVPPHIAAQNALDALRNEPWIPEPFFVKLSLILRTYLEDRFKLNAPESTTEELAEKLPREHKGSLLPFFEQADLVKFARADAQQEVMQTAFTTVEDFVEQTVQEEYLPQESTENSKKEIG
jgi:hypothetical protein